MFTRELHKSKAKNLQLLRPCNYSILPAFELTGWGGCAYAFCAGGAASGIEPMLPGRGGRGGMIGGAAEAVFIVTVKEVGGCLNNIYHSAIDSF